MDEATKGAKARKWVPSLEERLLARKVVLYYQHQAEELIVKAEEAGLPTDDPIKWARSLDTVMYLLLSDAKARNGVYMAALMAESHQR